jgi:hypothetical protein
MHPRIETEVEEDVEVAAFGEEEGSRFSAHIFTSSALVGAVQPALLETRDAGGWLAEAPQLPGIMAYGATEEEAATICSRRRPPSTHGR